MKRTKRTVIVLFLFAPIVSSQLRLELGVRIDAPLVGPLQVCGDLARCGNHESAPLRPAVGISASIPIVRRLRLRSDPVYQRVSLSATATTSIDQSMPGSPPGAFVYRASSTANRWQFPILIEARLLRNLHVGVGPAVSLLTGTEGMVKYVNPFSGTSIFRDNDTFPVFRQAVSGAAAALELPFHFGHVTLAPELRYKRWFDKHGFNWTMNEFTGGVAVRFSR